MIIGFSIGGLLLLATAGYLYNEKKKKNRSVIR